MYDLVIVGGGLIGGSLACTLATSGQRVALVEAAETDAASRGSYDERVIALSWGSRRILDAVGLWAAIAPEAEPIRRVHISDRGHFGLARLDHAELGVEALGYVTPARAIARSIQAALARASGVDLLCPAQVLDHRVSPDGVEIEVLQDGAPRMLHSRLLIAADGGESAVRRRLSLDTEERAYAQSAIISTVTPDRPRPGVAFERFTNSGPLALLPMTEGRYSVVWTCRDEETESLAGLSDADFLARLQDRFGYRLGRFGRPAPRRSFPLRLVLTRNPVQPRVVLIGNAAHTLHPVAGQGFNLGLRDVAALADVLATSAAQGTDPGSAETLDGYLRWRGRDQTTVATVTDTLARVFANPWGPLTLARGAGMLGLDLLPPARTFVARRFMGIGGKLPPLARGLSPEVQHERV